MNKAYLKFAKESAAEAGVKITNLFGNEQCYDKSINGVIIINNITHEEILATMKKLENKNN